MSIENTSRYSDTDLNFFKAIILKKIEKAQHDLDLIKSAYMNDLDNGTEDTSPTFKAFDEGSQVMSKESNSQPVLVLLRREHGVEAIDARNEAVDGENSGGKSSVT